jgi:uncharacterized membrane protein YeaQ/YmgE (transglycosylase-associated protein family)
MVISDRHQHQLISNDAIANRFYRDVISGLNHLAGFIMSIIGGLILLFIWDKMNP